MYENLEGAAAFGGAENRTAGQPENPALDPRPRVFATCPE